MTIQVFKDERGEWRFRFVADNNEIVVQSEGYKNRADAVAIAKKVNEGPHRLEIEFGK